MLIGRGGIVDVKISSWFVSVVEVEILSWLLIGIGSNYT